MDRYWQFSWSSFSRALGALAALIIVSACEPPPDELVRQYVEAANRHDLDAVAALLSDEVVWYLGSDTLVGKLQALEPLDFDIGAQTHLELRAIATRGDTAEFEMAEHNRVLMGLGIHELQHHVRLVFRDGLIVLIEASRPPGGIDVFGDSVAAFATWLHEEDADAYQRIWGADGRFRYSKSTGELMVRLLSEWRARDGS